MSTVTYYGLNLIGFGSFVYYHRRAAAVAAVLLRAVLLSAFSGDYCNYNNKRKARNKY